MAAPWLQHRSLQLEGAINGIGANVHSVGLALPLVLLNAGRTKVVRYGMRLC